MSLVSIDLELESVLVDAIKWNASANYVTPADLIALILAHYLHNGVKFEYQLDEKLRYSFPPLEQESTSPPAGGSC